MKYQKEYNRCKEDELPVPQQPDVIGSYILELCNRLATKGNFREYTFLDIMVGEAIENLVKAVMKYNPAKTDNIFNYFTTVAWRAFQFRIIEEKEQNYIKHKHYQHTYRVQELESNLVLDLSDNDYSNKVIDDFERKANSKAEIAKKSASQKQTTKDKSKSSKSMDRKEFIQRTPKGIEKVMVNKKKSTKALTTKAQSNTMGHI